jgi:pimeloyl-ACP methyl ester carboxylesterase
MPEWWDAPARERGLRMIGFDRPGHGNAPAEPNRSLRSVAEATAALMDDLGVDRFAVIGASGGGPYALACGAFLPDRVVAVISGAGSSGFDEAVDGAGMDPEELELTREQALRPTTEGRQALARFYDPEVENLRSADVDGFMSAVGDDRSVTSRSCGWRCLLGGRRCGTGDGGWSGRMRLAVVRCRYIVRRRLRS